MTRTLIVGAGPLGRATLDHLRDEGRDVLVATRSGTRLPGADAIAGDARAGEFADRVLAAGPLDAIVLAANIPYPDWARDWPRMIEVAIALAERAGARLVIAGNLYAYAPPTRPMRESDPLDATTRKGRIRADAWARALAAHEEGRIEAAEVRGSDYLGPGAGPNAHAGDRLVRPVLAGKTARPLGDPDAPRSWTAIDDFGRMLARAAHDPAMAGRAWHVPSAPAATTRELAQRIARAAGVEADPSLAAVPGWMLRAAGLLSPMMRELAELEYQFARPFVMADDDARRILGERETPLEDTIRAIIAAERDPARA